MRWRLTGPAEQSRRAADFKSSMRHRTAGPAGFCGGRQQGSRAPHTPSHCRLESYQLAWMHCTTRCPFKRNSTLAKQLSFEPPPPPPPPPPQPMPMQGGGPPPPWPANNRKGRAGRHSRWDSLACCSRDLQCSVDAARRCMWRCAGELHPKKQGIPSLPLTFGQGVALGLGEAGGIPGGGTQGEGVRDGL